MTTNASRPELKFNRYDAVVAAIVALLAVAVALWFYLPKTPFRRNDRDHTASNRVES